MFMPNDFGNGGGAPQGMGGPFDLQAQLAALPPQIRAQVMARMGMPGQGGMQAGLPDQGMNQTGPMPPPQGGMRPGLPGQGSQSGPIMDPRQGPPGPPQPMPAPGSGPVGGNPWGRSQAGPVTGQLNAQGLAAQQGIYGGFDPGRQGQMGPMPPPQMQPPKGPEMGMGQAPVPAPGGGNVLNPMPAPIARPIGNARGPQMNATDRAAAIAADKAMVGGAPPYVGKPKPMPQTDPPVGGTATDVKPLVGKPAPSPQQDPLQGATKPKPKPKPTLGRNYGPK